MQKKNPPPRISMSGHDLGNKAAHKEWMNECLTTPQHEKQIGYWVSEKGERTLSAARDLLYPLN